MAHIETKTTYAYDQAATTEWRLGTLATMSFTLAIIAGLISLILFFTSTITISHLQGPDTEVYNWVYLLFSATLFILGMFCFGVLGAAADVLRLTKLKMNYPYYGDIRGLIFSHKSTCSECGAPAIRNQTKCEKCGVTFEQKGN